uniref:ST8 alpha-N-acetyl-neuraminide alpha-2,8-sialyltransferase 6 n=1 Tax=Neogobius melanostomus TaxID=47308 RepID=A0A8C6WV92_9GOBI
MRAAPGTRDHAAVARTRGEASTGRQTDKRGRKGEKHSRLGSDGEGGRSLLLIQFSRLLRFSVICGKSRSHILVCISCGQSIDSAQFVIRCNLPPLEKWSKDVGTKTGLVTANPTIFTKNSGLKNSDYNFVDKVSIYGDSLLLLPAFSFAFCTDVSLKVHYTLQDFRSSLKTFFMNPDYLRNLRSFWRSQGLNFGYRMTTGLMMVSLAVEICNNVNVYGFWPFDNHPHGFEPLTQHYYDNARATGFHSMSNEFAYLVKLHNQGMVVLLTLLESISSFIS